MKVCIVAEGCYPYVVGGVSSWINSMIKAFPDIEFVVLAIVANRSYRGKFVYELPENVSEVYELYLEDYDWVEQEKNKKLHLRQNEYEALRSLLLNRDVEWDTLFTLFEKKNFSLNALLMGEDFLNAVRECYQLRYPQVVFSDFLWTMRSIYLPLFLTLKMELPEADLYHCVATGYAGVIGSMAKKRYGCGLMVSEHGIYTREREEELIRAKWVGGIYKNIWIEQFKKMSLLAYRYADQVTCLYKHAMELQIELGCPAEKIKITPNGIDDQRISEENALILNRMSCILYKGYFKGVMDDGIEEDEIEERVRLFIDDLDIIVKALASELQGYDGYFKQKREKNDKK